MNKDNIVSIEWYKKLIDAGDASSMIPQSDNNYFRAIAYIQLEILKTLQSMKAQEKDYWDTWKQAKQAETGQNKENCS